MSDRRLRIAHLYPRLMNIYGDRGNMLTLMRRCRDRGIDVEVDELGLGDTLASGAHDLIFMGGAQDRDQRRVSEDLLATKGPALLEAAASDTVILAVCGAYQLFGKHYVAASGEQLAGLGLFDCWTEHPGPAGDRLIGNVVAELEAGDAITLVGFENHGGRTFLGPEAQPLARVRSGFGNNGKDGMEGVRFRNAFGTYLHGSLLPKNPAFADMLIALALGETELEPLDDEIENAAHRAALKLTGRRR
ncbi:MAG: glutamine amidotransferase [Chloroflexi bacterium]|nr:glutamine amidotransferase [Chloroflexota bacterium]MCI0856764.1 glutamine amidotransferase [Chloroflexota bacterium]